MENEVVQERNFNLWQLAHWSQRALNLVIDTIVIICLQMLVLYFLKDYMIFERGDFKINLIFIIISFLYYVPFEFLTGKTIGKYITKTTVLTDGGHKPSATVVLLRTLCRFVPFEIFSCINERAHGWHNTWSHTIVVPDTEV